MTLADPTTPPADLIKDGSDATFMADVIEASKTRPGDRRLLGDLVRALPPADAGARKGGRATPRARCELVKIDVDKNPAYRRPAAGPVDPDRLRLRRRPAGRRLPGRAAREPDQGLHRQADRPAGAPARRRRSCWRWARNRWSSATSAARPRPSPRPCSSTRTTPRPSAAWRASIWPAATPTARRDWWTWPRPDAKDAELDSVRAAWPWPTSARATRRVRSQGWPPTPTTTRRGSTWPWPWPATATAGGRRPAARPSSQRDRDWNDERGPQAAAARLRGAGPTSDVAKRRPPRLSSILFSLRSADARSGYRQGRRPAAGDPGLSARRARCCCRAASCR